MELVRYKHPYLESQALRTFLSLENMTPGSLSDELQLFLERMDLKEYLDGEVIFYEGDSGDAFYLIDDGTIDIIKDSEGSIVINRLATGDYFGELALFTSNPRSATARANGRTTLFRLSKQAFEEMNALFPEVMGTLLSKLYDQLKKAYLDLEKRNELLKAANKERVELGFIFIWTVVIVSLYAFVIRLFHGYSIQGGQGDALNFIVNRGIEAIGLFLIIGIIYKSKLPLSSFGVTFKGSKRAITESLLISLVAIGVLTVFKWYLMDYNIDWFGSTSFLISFSLVDWTYFTYILVVPLQEFVVRGVVQGSIDRLLVGRSRTFWAIIVTSLIFGAMHLHSSVALGFAAMFSGLLWGWMYARHRNLVGVSLSHFFISNWAGVLGFWTQL